ncbi:MAG: Rrf2 family transcriptional regulator [Candidatus Melainabacteria bacterium]|jgi:Rrf2 family protein|nr:Rrf2 family transcriptional regulator [Candidatus Melainabacteria bacterium]
MISQTTEYALRAIVYLAMHSDTAFTTLQIAKATRVPPAYLAKVMRALGKANLVNSQRGFGGGFELTRKPSEITFLDVLNAVEPCRRIRKCPLGLESHGVNLCALHKRLDDAAAVIEETFAGVTIADILAKPTKSIPLIETTGVN